MRKGVLDPHYVGAILAAEVPDRNRSFGLATGDIRRRDARFAPNGGGATTARANSVAAVDTGHHR